IQVVRGQYHRLKLVPNIHLQLSDKLKNITTKRLKYDKIQLHLKYDKIQLHLKKSSGFKLLFT
ncbi:hypothetical protein, partial [Bacillus pseudomycoides]|uniref:hypothetical protein n=1 Tax=Bacillus pseudomycoides TaxID=64104 RepID=UPI001C3EC1EC